MKPMNRISKTLVFFLGLTYLAVAGVAQSEDWNKTDTTEISWGKRKLIIITDEEGKRVEIKKNQPEEVYEVESENRRYANGNDEDREDTPRRRKKSDVDLLGLDLGITNYYVNGVYGADAASPELALPDVRPGAHVALHLLPTTVSVIGRGVNLKSAISIDWNNYYYQHNLTMLDRQESVVFDSTGVNFSKNKLTTRYVQIPLLLNINTDPGGNDGVSISFGVYGGVLWKAWTKQVSDEAGKVKVDGTFNLNPIRYGLMARVDFKWFDIYANYNLSTLFTDGTQPATQVFNAGINILDF
jgi:hypothetical protein